MLAAVLNSPNYLSPDKGAAGHQALQERYDYVLRGMVSMGQLDSTEADRYYGKLPAVAKQRNPNQYGGQRGFMLSMVKQELRAKGFDDTAIDTGGLRVETTFTRKAMRAAEDGVLAQRPPGLKQLHVAAATRRRQDRRPDRLLRRAELPRQPAQLGQARRLPGLGLQAVRALGRASRPASASRTPSTATRPTSTRPGWRAGRQRGRGQRHQLRLARQPDQGDRGLDQHRLRQPDRLDPRRSDQDPEHGGRAGHPAQHPGPRAQPRDRARLGHDQPDQHGQRLRDHRQRRAPPRLVRDQEGHPRLRQQGALQGAAQDRPGAARRHLPRRQLRHAAGREVRHRPERAGARPSGRRQDRHGHQRRR